MDNLYVVVPTVFAILVLVFLARGYVSAKEQLRQTRLYRTLPTVREYLKAHPEQRNAGVTCIHCGSNQLGSYQALKHPVLGFTSYLGRTHFCRRCSTVLYTTPDLSEG